MHKSSTTATVVRTMMRKKRWTWVWCGWCGSAVCHRCAGLRTVLLAAVLITTLPLRSTGSEGGSERTTFELVGGQAALAAWTTSEVEMVPTDASLCEMSSGNNGGGEGETRMVPRYSGGIRISPRPVVVVAPEAKASPEACGVPSPFKLDAGVCIRLAESPSLELRSSHTATGHGSSSNSNTSNSSISGEVMCLPSFLIIGVMKGGTAEVQSWLGQHPLLHRWGGAWISGSGEAHYFDKVDSDANLQATWLSNYLRRGLALNATESPAITYTFEKTPSYVFMREEAIARVRRVLPSAKLILLLRSPAARAYSHFQHNCFKRRVWKVSNASAHLPAHIRGRVISMPSTLRGKNKRRRESVVRFVNKAFQAHAEVGDVQLLHHPCSARDFDVFVRMQANGAVDESAAITMTPTNSMVLRRGLYAAAIRRWLQHFDRSQLLILLTEAMQADMLATIDTILCDFLGIPRADYATHARTNERGFTVLEEMQSKSGKPHYGPMLLSTHHSLLRFYEEDIRELFAYVHAHDILKYWELPERSAVDGGGGNERKEEDGEGYNDDDEGNYDDDYGEEDDDDDA
ncbi:hypothetical protein PTSG_06403 [Salpingoeca rosetta]|uniref:Sulfotransferase domain-containing protein n=1 Tax=Salpingoeca rosetta (strain ATCC 50818 / BSB-021) TaxID=946362 RepID=F2UBX7_SALR5|nr:uncharacterized protein PTSG_06403 [Salpingoeca rosetta]EGD74392.1 hypothetical protein PTSG_06403 [Salpingoeca rosetta]|eukprot:XP_004993292.1 hypothetical protein PTSG_06403 [Salpingoeca rosetta]